MHIFYSWLFLLYPMPMVAMMNLLLNLMLLKPPPHPRSSPLPDASSTSRPFCSCDRWEGKDRARQQKALTCILLMDWGKSSKGSRELRMEAITGAPHVSGPRHPLKKMENHSDILLDTHYSDY